ncbi:MAG: type II toxin-antitoxin system VapC family toxin [Burkholderiales bacterium]
MAFVLDNSVASGWFLENQSSPYTEAIAARLQDETAHVPATWELEFTNVLRTACLRQRMTAAHAQSVIADFGTLPIEVDRMPARPSEILALALRFGLSGYDAAYLELALRMQVPIATKDGPLHEAAIASGVGVVV